MISSTGQVKALKQQDGGKHTKNHERILKMFLDGSGYRHVSLYKRLIGLKGRKHYKISRLVAKAFIPNPKNLPCVNHIDGDKLNDNVINLEWTTYSYNIQHAYDNGLRTNNKSVIQIDPITNKAIRSFKSISEAAKAVGLIKSTHISACALGRKGFHTSGGYKWKYQGYLKAVKE